MPPAAADTRVLVKDLTGIAQGAALTYPLELTVANETDPLTLQAEVVGPVYKQNGDLVGNYSLDSHAAALVGFYFDEANVLTRTSEGNDPNPLVQVGEDTILTIHAEWYGLGGYTISNLVLTDIIPPGYAFVSYAPTGSNTAGIDSGPTASATAAAVAAADNQTLAWELADISSYTVFEVEVTLRVLNDPVNADGAPVNHGTELTTRVDASFTFLGEDFDKTSTGYPTDDKLETSVTVETPSIGVTKRVRNVTTDTPAGAGSYAATVEAKAGDVLEYRLILTNAANRATAYNLFIQDTVTTRVTLLNPATDLIDNDGDTLTDEPDEGVASDTVLASVRILVFNETAGSGQFAALAAGASVVFRYRVTVGGSVFAQSTYQNSAALFADTLAGDAGGQAAPTGTIGEEAGARLCAASDDAHFTTPDVGVSKGIMDLSLTALADVAPYSGPDQTAVIGEEIQYQLAVAFPAATVADMYLYDNLPAGLTAVEATQIVIDVDDPDITVYTRADWNDGEPNTPLSADVTITPTIGAFAFTPAGGSEIAGTGVLWNLAGYVILFNAPRNYTPTVIARVDNAIGNQNNKELDNTDAVLLFRNDDTGTDTTLAFNDVRVTLREPNVTVTKTSLLPAGPDAGDTLTVTVTVQNTGPVSAYDVAIHDILTTKDLTYAGNITGTNTPTSVDTTAKHPVFTYDEVPATTTYTFTFDVTVDATAQPSETLDDTLDAVYASLPSTTTALNAGGRIGDDGTPTGMRNGDVPASGSINDYESTSSQSVTMDPLPAGSKTDDGLVGTAAANTIGARRQFTITVNLPEGTTNNLQVVDDLAVGSESWTLENNAVYDVTYAFTNITSINGSAPAEGVFTAFPADSATGTVTWNIGTVVTGTTPGYSAPKIVITYVARINNILAIQAADTLRNSAIITYNHGETGGTVTLGPYTPAATTVVEPVLTVAKTITAGPAAPDAGDTITYQIVIAHDDSPLSTADAYDVVVSDVLDDALGHALFADITDITAELLGGASEDVAPALTGGGTGFTAQYDIPFGGTVTLTCIATLQVSVEPGYALANDVEISYSSLNGGLLGTAVGPADGERTGHDVLGDSGGTLNDYYVAATVARTTDVPVFDKVLVSTATPTIGDLVTYDLKMTAPEGTTPGVSIVDTLAPGLAFVDVVSVTLPAGITTGKAIGTGNGGSAGVGPANVTLANDSGGTANQITFDLGDVVNSNTDDAARQVEIRFRAVVLDQNTLPAADGNQAGAVLANSATLSYTNGVDLTDSASVTVAEPTLTVAKAVSTNDVTYGATVSDTDAGDTIYFRITIANPSGANGAVAHDLFLKDEFDGTYYDTFTLVSLTKSGAGSTYVNGTGQALVKEDFAFSGNTLGVAANRLGLDQDVTLALVVSARLKTAVAPNQTLPNLATVRWSSVDQSLTNRSIHNAASGARTGGSLEPAENTNVATSDQTVLDNYAATADSADVLTLNPNATKSRVAVSESDPVAPNVAIGEVVRYRLVWRLPEGTTASFNFHDILPPGLTFLKDDTAMVAFVSTAGTGISSTAIAPAETDAFKAGDETTVAGIVPDYVIPGAAIEEETPAVVGFTDGEDVFFNLGTLTNSDSDADQEFVVVEFNAVVSNVATVTAVPETTIVNACRPRTGTTDLGTANASDPGDTLTVVEPSVTVGKTVSGGPYDAGDDVTYQIVITAGGTSTAFDVVVEDALSAFFDSGNVTGTSHTGTVSGISASFTGTTLTVNIDSMAVGATVTVNYTGELVDALPAKQVVNNTATLTYTSLPGTAGTVGGANTTGSTSGTAGTTTGERTGSGTGPNTYTDSSLAQTITSGEPKIAKTYKDGSLTADDSSSTGSTGSNLAIGETMTFDILVTLPEGLTQDLVVSDVVPSGLELNSTYQVITAAADSDRLTADFNGTVDTTPTISPALPQSGTTVTFTFGDTTVAGDNDGTNNAFVLRVVATALNTSGNDAGTVWTNTASLTYTDGAAASQTVTDPTDATDRQVTIAEPDLDVTKTLKNVTSGKTDEALPDAGDILEYTVTISHTGDSTAEAFGVAFLDTFDSQTKLYIDAPAVPAPAVTLNGTASGSLAGLPATGDTSLAGTFDIPDNGSTVQIVYYVKVEDTAEPADSLDNDVDITWSSLDGDQGDNERDGDGGNSGQDDYTKPGSASTTVLNSYSIAKVRTSDTYDEDDDTLDDSAARIGDIVTYTVTLTLQEGTTENLRVTDVLPAGFRFVDTVSVAGDTTPPYAGAGNFAYTVTAPAADAADTITWDFGTVVNTGDNSAANDTIAIVYRARIDDDAANLPAATTSADRTNSARLLYDDVDDNPLTADTPSDPTVAVKQPLLAATKSAASSGSSYGPNLLTNPGAENGFTGWTISQSGGDGWSAGGYVMPVSGSNVWHTSYEWCEMYQTVDLLGAGYSAADLDSAPEITASVYVGWGHGGIGTTPTGQYQVRAELLDASDAVVASWDTGVTNIVFPTPWFLVSHSFAGYGAGARKLRLTLGGVDGTLYWAEQYGPEFDEAAVRIDAPAAEAGETIAYTLTLTNNGAAPAYDVVVRDTIPEGMRANGINTTDGVRVSSMTLNDVPVGSPPEPVDAPDAVAFADNGIIEWNLDTGAADAFTILPGKSLVIVYQVDVDDSIGAGVPLANSASVPAYYSFDDEDVPTDADPGDRRTYGPVGPASATVTTVLPGPPTKTDPVPATIGGEITYTVEVPGDSGKANVWLYDVELLDTLPHFDANSPLVDVVSARFADTSSVGVVGGVGQTIDLTGRQTNDQVALMTAADGFDIPPEGQAILEVTVRIKNIAENQAGANVWQSGFNSVAYTYERTDGGAEDQPGGGDATARLTVLEPQLDATKTGRNLTKLQVAYTATPTAPDAGDIIEYQLVVTNGSTNASTAYDVNIVDTLGAGLQYVDASTAGGISTNPDVSGQTLTWGREQAVPLSIDLGVGSTLTFTYQVVVLDTTQPVQTLGNSVQVDWTSLTSDPAYERTGADGPGGALNDYKTAAKTASTTSLDSADLLKTRNTDTYGAGDADVRVGDVITYHLDLTLPEGTTTSAVVTDALPTGLEFVETVSINTDTGTGAGGAYVNVAPFTYAEIPVANTPTAGATGTLTWTLGTIENDGDNDPGNNVLTIVYRARVRNDVAIAGPTTAAENTASLAYKLAGGADATPETDNETVTVKQPVLTIHKTSSPAPDSTNLTQGQEVTFTVTVSNDTAPAPAYDVVVRDTIPVGMRDGGVAPVTGVRIVSMTLNGSSVVTPPEPVGVSFATTGVIEWNLDTGTADEFTIDPSGSLVIVYRVNVDSDIGAGVVMTNSASVTHYYSFDDDDVPTGSDSDDRRDYGSVGPKTVTLTTDIPGNLSKTATATAVVGETVTYTITVPANGGTVNATLYDVKITDTLPANMTYVNAVLHGDNDGTGFAVAHAAGTLTIDFATVPPTGQAIVVVTATVDNVLANQDATVLTNTASYTYARTDTGAPVSGGAAVEATTTVVEPNLNVVKTAENLTHSAPALTKADDIIKYTVTLTASGTTAYDVSLADQLGPYLAYHTDGTTYVPSVTGTWNTIGAPDVSLGDGTPGNEQTVTWSISYGSGNDGYADIDVEVGTPVTVTYYAKVLSSLAEGYAITNDVTARWSSLDGGFGGDQAGTVAERTGSGDSWNDYHGIADTFLYTTFGLEKTVLSGSHAAIGEAVTYQLLLSVTEGTTDSVAITDILPENMSYVPASATFTPASGVTTSLTTVDSSTADQLVFTLGTVTCSTPATNTVTIEYQLRVENKASNTDAAAKDNEATATATDVPDSKDGAGITIHEPALACSRVYENITKCGLNTTQKLPAHRPEAGDTLRFTSTITNTSATATAYDVTLIDMADMGIVWFDTASAAIVVESATLDASPWNGTTAPAIDAGTGQLSWGNDEGDATIDIPPRGTFEIVYTVNAISALGDNVELTGKVTATWSSIDGVDANERDGDGGNGGEDDYTDSFTHRLFSFNPNPTTYTVAAGTTATLDANGNLVNVLEAPGSFLLLGGERIVLTDDSRLEVTDDGLPDSIDGYLNITVEDGASATIQQSGDFVVDHLVVGEGATLAIVTGARAWTDIDYGDLELEAGAQLVFADDSRVTFGTASIQGSGPGIDNLATIRATTEQGGLILIFTCVTDIDYGYFGGIDDGYVQFLGPTTMDNAVFKDGDGTNPYVKYEYPAAVTWSDLAFRADDGATQTIENIQTDADTLYYVVVNGYLGPTDNYIAENDSDIEPAGTTGDDPISGVRWIGGTGTVVAIVYYDANGDGQYDAGDTLLAGVDVTVTDANGAIHNLTTDANGRASATVAVGYATVDIDQTDVAALGYDYLTDDTHDQGSDPTTVYVPPSGHRHRLHRLHRHHRHGRWLRIHRHERQRCL